jgi:hypothetical protein
MRKTPAMIETLPGISFHDAEVLALRLDRQGPTMELDIEVDAQTPDAQTVRLRFSGVSDLELGEFNHQNVLFDLEIIRSHDGTMEVRLDPSHGVHARFRCTEVEATP